jgi:hypothetical protein
MRSVHAGARSASVVAVAAVALLGFTAGARAAVLPTYTIVPSVTDAAIVDTSPTRGNNLVWLPARPVGKLLVFLPTGGPTNVPTEFTELATESARLGYHTIVLAYRNEAPIAALPTANPPGCGNGAEPADAPPNCAIDIRMEILDGGGESTIVDVNRANSIENRLNKLLVYLVATHPADGWAKYLDTSGATPQPKWSETVIAGSSLGAGQAAIIAAQHSVYRAALLHGWTDAKHGWVTLGATPSSRYATLIHARDNFFARTCYAYLALGLAPSCPLPHFTIPPATVDPANPFFVENRQPPFGTQQLVFDLEPGSFAGTGDWYHQSTSRDGWIAREADNTPSKKLLNAWRAVLGDSDADTYLDQADNCPMAANTDQADFDADGIGNACDPSTAIAGGVTGSVPATLSLTLGPAAAFGAFTPGLAKDYAASMTANVISTAGDAALSVADPSATATGHLVNGAFSLPSPLQAKASSPAAGAGAAPANVGGSAAPTPLLSYSGPASNDPVSLAFAQHIGAGDALRSGAYSKTLTFTLSTTTP